jgi:hypothetical protein
MAAQTSVFTSDGIGNANKSGISTEQRNMEGSDDAKSGYQEAGDGDSNLKARGIAKGGRDG